MSKAILDIDMLENYCNNCICMHCSNSDCFVSECEGARVEPEFLPAVIENCHKAECKGFREGEPDE